MLSGPAIGAARPRGVLFKGTQQSAIPTGGCPVAKASTGTLYRGREGMWSWVAHRVTGVGIFFFLLVHVLDTALDRKSTRLNSSHTSKSRMPSSA